MREAQEELDSGFLWAKGSRRWQDHMYSAGNWCRAKTMLVVSYLSDHQGREEILVFVTQW